MKIFISWSGKASGEIAAVLRDWLSKVIQEADVWVSSQDIAKGARWPDILQEKLAQESYGLAVITPENMAAPWIMFEAGAISKLVGSRYASILFGVTHTQIMGSPLGQFQNVIPTKNEILALLESINASAAKPLPKHVLEQTFEVWWDRLERDLNEIDWKPKAKTPTTPEDARIETLTKGLENVTVVLSRLQRTVESLATPALSSTQTERSLSFSSAAKASRTLEKLIEAHRLNNEFSNGFSNGFNVGLTYDDVPNHGSLAEELLKRLDAGKKPTDPPE